MRRPSFLGSVLVCAQLVLASAGVAQGPTAAPTSAVDVLDARAAALCAKAACTKEVTDLVTQARKAVTEARTRLAAGNRAGSDRAVAVGDAALVLAELVGRRTGLAEDVTRARARTKAAVARAAASERAASRTTVGAKEHDARPPAETAPATTTTTPTGTDAGSNAP